MEIDRRIIIAFLSGEADAEERARLDEWRAERPANEAEFQRQSRTWKLLGVLSGEELPSVAVEPARSGDHDWLPRPPSVSSSRRTRPAGMRMPRRWSGLVAASLLIGLALGALLSNRGANDRLAAHDVVTGIGEVATLTLRDGTVVRLGPESRLTFDGASGPRDVTLEGQAFFAVPSGQRDRFRVHTAGGEVTVLGTRFDVRSRGEGVEVIVVEGEVAMAAGEREVSVTQGQMGSLDSETAPVVQAVDDVYAATDWIGNFIAYETTPLADVAAEFRSRFDIELRIADDRLAARTVTGWFRDQTPEEIIGSICLAVDAVCTTNEGGITMSLAPAPAVIDSPIRDWD